MRGLIASTTRAGMGRSVELAEKQGISRTRRCRVWIVGPMTTSTVRATLQAHGSIV